MKAKTLQPEIAQATLDCARSDVDYEIDRARALDSKLTGIASLSGLALSIGASVGASLVASGDLSLGFSIALGAVLSLASMVLLTAAGVALWGLTPKPFQGTSIEAGKDRVSDERLGGDPAEEIAELAATYYVKMLPEARATNKIKVRRARWAYWFVGLGLAGLVLGLVLSTVGAVT